MYVQRLRMTVSRETTFKTVTNAWHDRASSMHRARVHISHAVILQRLHQQWAVQLAYFKYLSNRMNWLS